MLYETKVNVIFIGRVLNAHFFMMKLHLEMAKIKPVCMFSFKCQRLILCLCLKAKRMEFLFRIHENCCRCLQAHFCTSQPGLVDVDICNACAVIPAQVVSISGARCSKIDGGYHNPSGYFWFRPCTRHSIETDIKAHIFSQNSMTLRIYDNRKTKWRIPNDLLCIIRQGF